MPSLRIILNPESQGLGEEFVRAHQAGKLIHLDGEEEIVVSGLPDGMASGKPSMMFGFVLPDGSCVVAETSWKLFSAAYMAFAGKFGVERPDASGTFLEYDATGGGQRVRLELLPDGTEQFFQCQICGDRIERPAGVEEAIDIVQIIHCHYREKHPDAPVPEIET